MARPNSTGLTNRVQVEAAPAPPGVGVYAPLDVQAAPPKSAQAFASLAQALSTAANVGAAIKEKRDPLLREQGRADQTLGEVDAEKEGKYDAYAEGVYEARVIGEYNDVERRVIERMPEIDRSLPHTEQVAQIDRMFKEELGDLAQDDPKARLLIAQRYNQFIQNTAGSIVQAQLEDMTQRSLDTVTADLAKNPTAENWSESFDRVYAITGNRRAALQTALAAVSTALTTAAANEPLETVEARLDQIASAIPAQVTLEDGTVKDGPLSSPEHAEAWGVVQDQVQSILKQRRAAVAAEKYWDVVLGFEKKIEAGQVLRETEVKYWVDQGVITDEKGIALIEESWAARRAAQEKQVIQNVFAVGRDWRSLQGIQIGDKRFTEAEAQKQFNDYIMAYAPTDPQTGDRDFLGFALNETRRHGLPFEPIKSQLSNLGANPAAVVNLLDTYKKVKAVGLTGLYVSEDSAVLFEEALDLERMGTEPAQIRARLERINEEDVSHVRTQMPEVSKGVPGVAVDYRGINVSVGDLANSGYARTRIESFARRQVLRGRAGKDALDTAAARFRETHGVVEIKSGKFIVPRAPGLDLDATTAALKQYEQTILPQYAERAGIPVEEVSFEILAAPGGKGVELWPVDSVGDFLSERPLSLFNLTMQYNAEQQTASYQAAQAAQAELMRIEAEDTERRTRNGAAIRGWAESMRNPKPYVNPYTARER